MRVRLRRWSGKKMRLVRVLRGLSQSQLARRLRASPHHVSRWERGVAPSLIRADQIARALGVATFKGLF